MTIRRAAIVAPMRTPVGTFGGSLRDVPVEDLAATAVKAVMERTGLRPGGHGYRMLATGLRELRRRGGRYLLETMCVGGGQGVAAVFEAA